MSDNLNVTREEIEQLAIGRTLDILIATKVLGWTMHPNGRSTGEAWAKLEWEHDFVPARFNGDLAHAQKVPHYSYSANAAFDVVEELNKTHYLRLDQKWTEGGSDGGVLGYEASFWRFKTYEGKESISVAPAPALAICRAALLTTLAQPLPTPAAASPAIERAAAPE